jgi:hypothetical protein
MLYTDKSNCRRAARKALGIQGGEGTAFVIIPEGDKYRWEKIEAQLVGAETKLIITDEAIAEPLVSFGLAAPVIEPTEAPAPEPGAINEAPKALDTIDPLAAFGITAEALTLIAKAADARCVMPIRRRVAELGARSTTINAWEAARRGELPAPLIVPESNAHVRKRADAFRAMAEAGDLEGLTSAEIGGTNTYAKALRSYRDALVHYVKLAAPDAANDDLTPELEAAE